MYYVNYEDFFFSLTSHPSLQIASPNFRKDAFVSAQSAFENQAVLDPFLPSVCKSKYMK